MPREGSKIDEKLKKMPASTKLMMAVMAVLLVVICVFGWLLLQKQDAAKTAGTAPALDSNMVSGMSLEEARKLRDEQQAAQDKNSIIVSMATVAVFPGGGEQGTVDIENAAENEHAFTVAYLLTADGRKVIETGLLPPNSYLEKASLLEPLPKGSYPASAIYTTYDTEGNVLGSVGVAVTIEVKS